MTPDDGTEALLVLLLDLQAQVLGQEDALAALRREGDALRAAAGASEDRAVAAEERLRQALDTLEAERARIAGLEAELARIRASRAWRLTAPLRRMRGWLKRRA